MYNCIRKRSGFFGAMPWIWCGLSKRQPGQDSGQAFCWRAIKTPERWLHIGERWGVTLSFNGSYSSWKLCISQSYGHKRWRSIESLTEGGRTPKGPSSSNGEKTVGGMQAFREQWVPSFAFLYLLLFLSLLDRKAEAESSALSNKTTRLHIEVSHPGNRTVSRNLR